MQILTIKYGQAIPHFFNFSIFECNESWSVCWTLCWYWVNQQNHFGF